MQHRKYLPMHISVTSSSTTRCRLPQWDARHKSMRRQAREECGPIIQLMDGIPPPHHLNTTALIDATSKLQEVIALPIRHSSVTKTSHTLPSCMLTRRWTQSPTAQNPPKEPVRAIAKTRCSNSSNSWSSQSKQHDVIPTYYEHQPHKPCNQFQGCPQILKTPHVISRVPWHKGWCRRISTHFRGWQRHHRYNATSSHQ